MHEEEEISYSEPEEYEVGEDDDESLQDDEPPMEDPIQKRNTYDNDDLGSILTENAETAAVEAFAKLSARSAISHTSGISIEDVVREEIRPMLRDWVDEYLPPLIERLLQEELDRVSRRARGE